MKPSATRLKLITGAFGVLCVSLPVLISAQAVPVGENAVPVGEGAVNVGADALPIGEGAVPLAAAAGSLPVGEGAIPLNVGGIPVGEGAVMNVAAQQRRLQNRATATSNPSTSRFFTGDAGVRLGNVSGNIASATGSPSTLTGPSIAQQDAEDREWSLGAIATAGSRPADLFTKDWWTAHSEVLSGANRYYSHKPDFSWWQGSPWGELIRVLGMRNAIKPFKYVNDRNITFRNDVIYVNGQAVSSYEDFVASARALANGHPDAIAERPGWFPLGTFAVSSSMKQKTSSQAIQLAMDSAGNIVGAYVNWPKGDVLPIRGSVDTNSQRVAFSIGGSDNIVIETGLANLTEANTRVWAHLPNSHSQTWLITRIAPGAK